MYAHIAHVDTKKASNLRNSKFCCLVTRTAIKRSEYWGKTHPEYVSTVHATISLKTAEKQETRV